MVDDWEFVSYERYKGRWKSWKWYVKRWKKSTSLGSVREAFEEVEMDRDSRRGEEAVDEMRWRCTGWDEVEMHRLG